MNLSSMYQIIAEHHFPEIRQLWTGLTWSTDGYEIVEMKIYEEMFGEWEEKTKCDISSLWLGDRYHGLKCAIFDYGGLSIMIGFNTIIQKADKVNFSTKLLWTERLTNYAKLVGKNPSIVLVDEWLGGKRYRRNFWRWQPVETGKAKGNDPTELTLRYLKAAMRNPALPEGVKNSIRDSLPPDALI